jgi:hypothetical protein
LDADPPAAGRSRERHARGARARGGRGRDGAERRKGRGGWVAFLLASLVPAGALAWFFLQPEDRRKALLDQLPAGAGGRAVAAGVSFGVLVLLARVALPAFHGASGALRATLARFRARRGPLRALLFPVELVLGLVWFLFQLLFALDAFLILVCALVGLLLVVRIAYPALWPDVLPQFAERP